MQVVGLGGLGGGGEADTGCPDVLAAVEVLQVLHLLPSAAALVRRHRELGAEQQVAHSIEERLCQRDGLLVLLLLLLFAS